MRPAQQFGSLSKQGNRDATISSQTSYRATVRTPKRSNYCRTTVAGAPGRFRCRCGPRRRDSCRKETVRPRSRATRRCTAKRGDSPLVTQQSGVAVLRGERHEGSDTARRRPSWRRAIPRLPTRSVDSWYSRVRLGGGGTQVPRVCRRRSSERRNDQLPSRSRLRKAQSSYRSAACRRSRARIRHVSRTLQCDRAQGAPVDVMSLQTNQPSIHCRREVPLQWRAFDAPVAREPA
jgi:hypothetical protein